MNGKLEPWSIKANLRETLLSLKEDKNLDSLIIEYVREIFGHRIIMRPSKGPYGEKGKDIVAIENEENGNYCSYIVKRGSLQKNLDGKYGILNQIEMAMLIDLEIDKYKRKSRTAIVVHNGDEGYRGAIARFDKHCRKIEKECGYMLLRPIERWDIDELVNRLFEYSDILRKNAEMEQSNKRRMKLDEAATNFIEKYEKTFSTSGATAQQLLLAEQFYKDCKKIEYMHGPFKRIINN